MTVKSKRGGARPGAGRKRKPKTPKGEPLKNAKHEKFAQALAQGKGSGEAYQEAGYEPNRGNASRLKAQESIQARVEELKKTIVASVIARSTLSKEYVLGTLIDTLERCRQASPVLDRKGEIIMVENTSGELVPAYVFDAKNVLRSAELIGKELGMFKDRVEHTGADGGPIETKELSRRELAQRAAFLLRRAQSGAEDGVPERRH